MNRERGPYPNLLALGLSINEQTFEPLGEDLGQRFTGHLTGNKYGVPRILVSPEFEFTPATMTRKIKMSKVSQNSRWTSFWEGRLRFSRNGTASWKRRGRKENSGDRRPELEPKATLTTWPSLV